MRLLTAITVVLNDFYLNDLGTHTRDDTNFFPFSNVLFLYTSIHCMAALLQIIHRATWILLGTPYYVCALESLGFEPSIDIVIDEQIYFLGYGFCLTEAWLEIV